jgi:hypothetical protein
MIDGINQQEAHNFCDYCIKANDLQLKAMVLQVFKEIEKRKNAKKTALEAKNGKYNQAYH